MNLRIGYDIAKRIKDTKLSKQVSVSVNVAIVSIALSIIIMIISVAVVRGFRESVSQRVFDFAADFQVVGTSSVENQDQKYISTSNSYIGTLSELPYVYRISQYAIKPVLLNNNNNIKGVVFKGVNCSFDPQRMAKYLVDGENLELCDSIRRKELVISRRVSEELAIGVGERLEVVYVDSTARRDIFTIKGIYSSAIGELDDNIIFGDIRDIQRVNGWSEDMVSGYDIFLKSEKHYLEASEEIPRILYTYGSSRYRKELLNDTRDEYSYIFGWLDMHKTNEMVIITIMMIVSIFNVVSMTLILLLQRTSMIGILKSMGMSNFTIQSIFIIGCFRELVKGVLYGNVIGIGLALLQQKFNIIKLDMSSYMIDSVPISIGVWQVVALNVILVSVLVVSQVIATSIISKIEPYKAIKYEKR